MSSKKKLIISLSSLAAVAVVAILAVSITLAALTANVKSGFSIKYHALNVEATVSASYKLGSGSLTALTPTSSKTELIEENSIKFTKTTTTAEASASFTTPAELSSGFELTASNPTVTFFYTFINNATADDLKISLDTSELTTKLASKNVEVKFGTADAADETGTTAANTAIASWSDLTVSHGATKVVAISFSIQDNLSEVDVTANINWTLDGNKATA